MLEVHYCIFGTHQEPNQDCGCPCLFCKAAYTENITPDWSNMPNEDELLEAVRQTAWDVDPVQVHEAWIATCDSCGWHTQPASPMGVVREWARLHRVTCPLKTGT